MMQKTAWHVSSNVISGEPAVQTAVGEILLPAEPDLLQTTHLKPFPLQSPAASHTQDFLGSSPFSIFVTWT